MYRNWCYCKLKTGEIMVVFIDNEDRETMHVFPVSELEDYDAEFFAARKFLIVKFL